MPDSYTIQWQEYRRRLRWAIGVTLGMGPLAALWLLVEAHTWLQPLAIALGFVWLTSAAVTGFRFGLWPCPRCGRPFAMASLRDWFLSMEGDRLRALITAHCLHCRLPKWALKDPDSPSNVVFK